MNHLIQLWLNIEMPYPKQKVNIYYKILDKLFQEIKLEEKDFDFLNEPTEFGEIRR